MKNIFLLIVVVTLSSTITQLFSQSVKQYSGEFSNGSGTPGKATFSYYEKDGAQIKNGKFSYSQNVDGTYGFYNCSISGSYKDNNKDGAWIYNISFKDYNTGMGNIYTTGSIKLTSNYINGFPNGNWNYIETNQARSKTLTGWTAYDLTTTTTVSANFKNGVLVGNFKMKGDIDNDDVSGTMDEKGYCINEWVFHSGKTNIKEIKYQFYKNIQIKYIAMELATGQIIKKSDFTENEITLLKNYADGLISYNDLKNNGIKIDTNEFDISLKSTFHNSNFIPDYITGDFYGKGFYIINANAERIKLKKLNEIDSYSNNIKYMEDPESFFFYGNPNPKDPKSHLSVFKELLKNLTSIYKENETSLSKDDVQTLKAKMLECENLIKIAEKLVTEKENERNAIEKCNPSNSDIETLENILKRGEAYNKKYIKENPSSRNFDEMPIDLSMVKFNLKIAKQEARKKEYQAILVFNPKKQDKETLIKTLQLIKSFKEKNQDITDNEKSILDEKTAIIEKALKKM